MGRATIDSQRLKIQRLLSVGKNAEQWDNSYIMLVEEKNDSSNLNVQFRILGKLEVRSWNSYHTISHCSFKYIPNKCISDDMYKNIHSSVVCKRKKGENPRIYLQEN